VLNCQPHDAPVLVAARLLKPLGNPPPNTVKFFAVSEDLEQVQDRAWLAEVTNALNQHWQRKNAVKRKPTLNVHGSPVRELVMAGGVTCRRAVFAKLIFWLDCGQNAFKMAAK
jgi:hypothetical protein